MDAAELLMETKSVKEQGADGDARKTELKCQLKDVEEGEGKNIAVELRGEPPVEPELVQACRECDNKDEILFFVFVFQFLIFLLWTCKESNNKDERVGGRVDQAKRELTVQDRGQGGVGRAVP